MDPRDIDTELKSWTNWELTFDACENGVRVSLDDSIGRTLQFGLTRDEVKSLSDWLVRYSELRDVAKYPSYASARHLVDFARERLEAEGGHD